MPRYKLLVEYDGGPYAGFQAQANLPTVQGALEAAIYAFSGETLRIAAAGRTDTGVHAAGQVVHVDLAKTWKPDTVRDALNAHLVPQPVAVLSAEAVSDDFHVRFSALSRHYLFRILNRRYSHAHVERLHQQNVQSIETSSLHLGLLGDMKRLNSLFCAVAYSVMEQPDEDDERDEY